MLNRTPPDVLEEAARRARESRRLGIRPGQWTPRVERRHFALPTPHIDPAAPLRVAHLSDLHVGRVTPMKTQLEAVRLTNEAEPDLVVLTGDFVCHSLNYLDALQDVLGRLDAPAVAVLGNHDYWAGGGDVGRALSRAGVEVLHNDLTSITLHGERLQLVGLDDAYTGHADRRRALRGLRRDLPAIGLSHIAEEADPLWTAGVPAVFSGHTHGGQITLAGLHDLIAGKVGGHKYVHGLYGCRRGEAAEGAVYVNAGVGAAVMPLRIGERGTPEVSVFELGAPLGTWEEHHTEQMPLPGRKPSRWTQQRRIKAVNRKWRKRQRRG